MKNIYIKKLFIENYKCFENKSIDFGVPNGEKGSGLNILIGENGNGKTTILEAINYLTQNTYSSENKLKINDFKDYEKQILIKGETEEFNCKMPYQGNYFECNGFEFIVKSRDRKAPGKLLSSPFQINNYFLNKTENYKNSKNQDSGKSIQDLYKVFNNGNIIDDEINIFYFDKNRTRQITTGNYKTTFEKICDDLNWKFIKNIDKESKEKITKNINGEYFKNVVEIAQKGSGKKVASELKQFFDKDEYEKINIELIDLLHPFSNSFFALKNEDELKQINTKDLGSGVEMILTLLLLKNIAGESKGSIIYLIDEPELHLHPKAQEKLLELLLEESKDKQIFLSTHSPYLFKNCLSEDTNLLILNRDQDDKIQILNARDEKWKIFPWSPSWGEINYKAYDLATKEFHNELYGYLQEITEKYTEKDFEKYLNEDKKINKSKKWTPEKNGGVLSGKDVTLQTFIRNKIHHPENKTMQSIEYTDTELKESINKMINLIEEETK